MPQMKKQKKGGSLLFPRTFEGFYKTPPDRPDSPQKEDMSGEKRTYGHPISEDNANVVVRHASDV